MKISCLINPYFGTGIARYIQEVASGLAQHKDCDTRLLISPVDVAARPDFFSTLPKRPSQRLPIRVTRIDRLWKLFRWPTIDRVVQDCNVVYSPFHARIATKRVPWVTTIFDVQALENELPWSHTSAHRRFRAKWRAWLPKAGREASRIITISEFSKQRLVDLLDFDPAKIGVVGCGVRECFFAARRDPLHELSNRVVVIGGIRTTKGASDTLAVARELERRRSPLTICVVGQNDSQWVSAAQQMPNVRLLGPICDLELASMLARSVALLFLSPYEGFGIPAAEAMAAGTPAVVSNCASLPEVVGDAGIVVAPASSEEIADVLERLRLDQDYRKTFVDRGHERVQAFTWQKCVDRLVVELRTAVESGS